MSQVIRIGTRTSPLAMWQAHHVASLIQTHDALIPTQVIGIETNGDLDRSSPLNQIGGKGVFIREIEQALIDHQIDIGVHCLKDVTTHIHSDTHLSAFLRAESVADVLVSRKGYTLETIPLGATVGTGSMRRQALLRSIRPDLVTVPIRGNIDTRINRISAGDCAGILLSEVSITRLVRAIPYAKLNPESFIPAPGQGVIALQTRRGDVVSNTITQAINDPNQYRISESQLQFLLVVGFDCSTPLGLHTVLEPDQGQIRHIVFRANPSHTQTQLETIVDSTPGPNTNLVTLAHAWHDSPLV